MRAAERRATQVADRPIELVRRLCLEEKLLERRKCVEAEGVACVAVACDQQTIITLATQ